MREDSGEASPYKTLLSTPLLPPSSELNPESRQLPSSEALQLRFGVLLPRF